MHTGVLVFCSEQLAVLLQPLVCLLFSLHCLCNHFENLLLVHLLPYLTCLLPDHINHLVQVLPWELYEHFPTKWCNSSLHVQSRLLLRQMACIGINCERPYHWLKLLVLVCSPGDPPASQTQLVVSVANKMVLFPTQSIEGFSNNGKFKDELCKWTMKLLHIK